VRSLKNILVTGGAGFIGSNFVRFMLEEAKDAAGSSFSGCIINLDALTYAGNPMNLEDISVQYGPPPARQTPPQEVRYFFEQGDICDKSRVEALFSKYAIDTVVHFAAESHVDRSILGPEAFIKTNVMGTFTLLDTARAAWKTPDNKIREDVLFHHISTDEVYGSLGETGAFTETTPYDPRSPYSASKAGSDHLAMAYSHTYSLPVTLSSCSNNYGPYQFPEKLIPLMLLNVLEGKPLPVYGDGKNIRDWLYVEDHARAVWTIMQKGTAGAKYNIGGENEWENIKLLEVLIGIVSRKARLDPAKVRAAITYVKDRPGHDRRYAIDCSRLKSEFGWKQTVSFEEGLERTVDWYLANPRWIESIRSGEYRSWLENNYEKR
jgi:dTDP-glucose 4,6-dehydratase